MLGGFAVRAESGAVFWRLRNNSTFGIGEAFFLGSWKRVNCLLEKWAREDIPSGLKCSKKIYNLL